MANGSLIYSWYNGSCYIHSIHGHGKKTIGFYILQFPRCDNFVKIQVGRRQPYWIPNITIHATFTTSCHINSTGLKTCRWNQKRRFYLKRFPRYDNFSKSNMAAVAILDFWENCSYYIYDTMLDVFLEVENMDVQSKIKSLCWSSSEI